MKPDKELVQKYANNNMNMLNLVLITLCLGFSTVNITRIPPTNPPPPQRLTGIMLYNNATNQLVIFGGTLSISLSYNDVWTFDLNTLLYHNLVPTSSEAPDPRFSPGGFIDSSNNKFYIFGGNTPSGSQNDMWCFDLTELKWEELYPTGAIPSPNYRFGYQSYYDQGLLKFLIFGGNPINGKSNQVYGLATNTWNNLNTSGDTPEELDGPVIEIVNKSMYLFGGENLKAVALSDQYPSNTYKLDLTTLVWTQLNLSTTYENRYFTGSTVIDNKIILLSGWSDSIINDVNNFMYLDLNNLTGWNNLSMSSNCQVMNSYGYATVNSTIYLFSGYLKGNLINSLISIENGYCSTISPDTVAPTARMYQSMVTISAKLYMYGGMDDSGNQLEELWVFDIDSLTWSSPKIVGLSPGARSGHAATSEGDVMVVWGGTSSSGSYLSDMYLYGAYNGGWIEITPSGTIPSGRNGACIVMQTPKIYIFGGKTISGKTTELWEYDMNLNAYTLITPQVNLSITPNPVIFPTCTMVNNKFWVIFGTADSEFPETSIYQYDFDLQSWNVVFDAGFSLMSRSLGVVEYINGQILVLAGEAWSTDPYNDSFVLNVSSGNRTYLKSLPEYYFGGAYSLYTTIIYMFGGGSVIGGTLRTSASSSNFYSYNIIDFGTPSLVLCSPGSYLADDGTCIQCSAGTYATSFGQTECSLCQPGTFNTFNGASSIQQCYPCDQGFFSSTPGSTICYGCPDSYYCPIGSHKYYDSQISSSTTSLQPLTYSPDVSTLNKDKLALYLVISFLLLLFTLMIYCYKTIRNSLTAIDLYTFDHNYQLENEMIMKKNKIGGYFSVVFVFIAILLIVSAGLDYFKNNVIENKTLLPLVILENIASQFVGTMSIRTTLYYYGGSCNNSDGQVLSSQYVNIIAGSMSLSAMKEEANCVITWNCLDCQIQTGSYIEYSLSEITSYCSGIGVNVTSSSSIPNQISSIQNTVVSDSHKVFRGYGATVFTILMTPSLYISADSSSKSTGYHVSLGSDTKPGTQYTTSQFPFSSGLNVQINLQQDSNGLYTLQTYKQTLILLGSSLLGSVFGMMGAVGNIMRLLENQFKNTKSYLQKIEDFENLYKNHKDLKKETIPVADKSTEKNIRIGISDIELSIDSI